LIIVIKRFDTPIRSDGNRNFKERRMSRAPRRIGAGVENSKLAIDLPDRQDKLKRRRRLNAESVLSSKPMHYRARVIAACKEITGKNSHAGHAALVGRNAVISFAAR
jgi:hypothetical protein